MSGCSLCGSSFEVEIGEDGICTECRQSHALAGPSEPVRPPRPCERCQGRSFVRVKSIRIHSPRSSEAATAFQFAPLAATYDFSIQETFFTGRQIMTPDLCSPLGTFEAYICRSCGHTELYARDAARIPIGQEYNTELLELPDGGPYR